MTTQEILLAMSAPDGTARGSAWRITAKKSDYYLDFPGQRREAIHLSIHGPNDQYNGHRFHIKADPKAVQRTRDRGEFFEHNIPRKGQPFNGVQLAENAFLVARLRWTWDLQRPRYRESSLTRDQHPRLTERRSGLRFSSLLKPNNAWDIDLVVSYGAPFWSYLEGADIGNSKIGPLANGAGMFLTARSHHRKQSAYPSPQGLQLPPPRAGEAPTTLLAGGLGPNRENGIYWFVEGITSHQHMNHIRATIGRP